MKSREEQRKDFEEILSSRADSNCKMCYGRGYQGWDDNEKMFIPCVCLLSNVYKEVSEAKKETPKNEGLLNNIRQMIGLN